MQKEGVLILDNKKISQKITRMAYEIYEHNFQEELIILAGIDKRGYLFCQLLAQALEEISPLKVKQVRLSVENKKSLQGAVTLDCELSELDNQSIILVDDVMNTGRTMAYSLKPFLNVNVKKLETAVLVNRSHKLFPISADYTGYELATTMSDHIEVKLEEEDSCVFLY